jgi:hypothetical protein
MKHFKSALRSRKLLLVILVLVSLISVSALISYKLNHKSCWDSNTFIENYWSNALRWDFWNIIADAKPTICQYGCFEGRCLSADEVNKTLLPGAPDLPPEPSYPIGLD